MSFDYEKLKKLQEALNKHAQFVPMDPAAGGDPAAAGGPPPGDPAAMAGGDPAAMGMDPAMAGGDPAAMGMDPAMAGGDPAAMGMDPAAAGMPPMDPAAMGADPAAMGAPPPMDDPAAGGDVSPSGEPYMKITPTQLSKLFKQFAEVFKSVLGLSGQPGAAAPAAPQTDPNLQAKLTEVDAKLNALMGSIGA